MEGVERHLSGRFAEGLSSEGTNHLARVRYRLVEARLDLT